VFSVEILEVKSIAVHIRIHHQLSSFFSTCRLTPSRSYGGQWHSFSYISPMAQTSNYATGFLPAQTS